MLERLLARWRLRRCASVGAGVRVMGRVDVRGEGEIHVGDGVTLDGSRVPIELRAFRGGAIVIDNGARIDGGASIEARRSIRVGAGAHLGAFCKVMDNHQHRVHGDRWKAPDSTPIAIEADAEIGPRAVLLPGARIGRGARVVGGAVVSRPVPPQAIASGVPATVRR